MLGQQLDTNSASISTRLADLGVRTLEHRTVDDDAEQIAGAIRAGIDRADLVIVSGGLGPTKDDLTRRALAMAMGTELVEDERALAEIMTWFAGRGRTMSQTNRVQALRPSGARSLTNPRGTAPGLHARIAYDGLPSGSVDVYCLPGPPRELLPMLEAEVLAPMRASGAVAVEQRILRTIGLGESSLAEKLGELMDRDRGVLVGTTASSGMVSVRIRCEGATTAELARGGVDEAAALVRERLGGVVFGEGDVTIADAVVSMLIERGESLTVAESCTGGLVGAAVTSVPGSSSVFGRGYLTYANEAKVELLGVEPGTLEQHGAVSGECAQEMALGALRASGADHAIAITGIAGPDGGSDDKPVGTVWIGIASAEGAVARRFGFPGERENVRALSVKFALAVLRQRLLGIDEPMLWQEEAL